MSPTISVVIATCNRCADLRVALDSVFAQTMATEVIVLDDASTDETSEMVRDCFPSVRFERSAQRRGYISLRNAGARIARGDIIFSLDDDAELSTDRVIEQTVRDFSSCRIGAVAVPFIEPKKSKDPQQCAPDLDQVWVTDSFKGTAHALRRNIFLNLGGYRAHLIHQGEEMDYCIRLLNAGLVTRLGSADAIYHYESSRRDTKTMDFFGRRNDILFVWHNVPTRNMPMHFATTTWNGLRATLQANYPWRMICGISAGYTGCVSNWSARAPVSRQIYRLHRRLRKSGPLPLKQVEKLLPSIELRPFD
jgi:glycosyltransferase involved in cell wall biosynthesis